jgi:hypothetical protein
MCGFRLNVITFAYGSAGDMGPACKNFDRFPRRGLERPHVHWFGPTPDDFGRELIARMKSDRTYACADAGPTNRMNRPER